MKTACNLQGRTEPAQRREFPPNRWPGISPARSNALSVACSHGREPASGRDPRPVAEPPAPPARPVALGAPKVVHGAGRDLTVHMFSGGIIPPYGATVPSTGAFPLRNMVQP